MNKTKFEILKVLVLVSARLMPALSCRQRSQAIPMKRWNAFLKSLALEQRVDFEEGDIGLPGGAADCSCAAGFHSFQ